MEQENAITFKELEAITGAPALAIRQFVYRCEITRERRLGVTGILVDVQEYLRALERHGHTTEARKLRTYLSSVSRSAVEASA